MHLDPDAASTSDLPAFLSPPEGAPVYYGFVVLDETEVDGFRLGVISGFGEDAGDCGDAFVVAPDGSRAGLVWEVGESAYIREISGFEPGRWGVWEVGFTRPMRTPADARANLEQLLPRLRVEWTSWKSSMTPRPGRLSRIARHLRRS
jgi:hypothetical protein